MTRTIAIFFLLLTGIAAAGEAPKPAEAAVPKAEAKQEDVEVNMRGLLLAKPKDAAEGVVATFIVFPKKFEIVDERKAVNLYAKGDVAKQIAEMSRERTKVELIGIATDTGINVTKIETYTGKAKLKKEKQKEREIEAAAAVKANETTPAKPDAKPKLPRGDEEF